MPVKRVLEYPHEALTQVCEPIEDFEDEDFQSLINDLRDTCEAYRGEGIAAPQIGVNKRVFVVGVDKSAFKVYVNPEIIDSDGKERNKEGCLSFPGIVEFVERAEDVTVKAQDEIGEEFTVSADGVEAIALQHEMDHLDGILFIERMSPLSKRYALRKLIKLRKRHGR